MASLEVPPTQSTAPVFEYRCLYTPDLRRKQKRWQDGRLTFHTFNKRVMVYDDRSNFVGDTHWREDELGEGEELELDRRGILVEVGECTGQKNQDVSELTDKPRKDKEERAAARAAATPVAPRNATPSGPEFLQPKPLNQILTPSGHYGRAVIPTVSPFEERQKLTSRTTDENERPTKRRRQDDTSNKNGYAQNLMGASLNLSYSRTPSTASIRYEPLKLKTAPSRKPEATIDLTEDSDHEGSVSGQQNGGREEPRKRDRPSVKKRQKKSPIAKSTYAGNLTGAALSLSRSVAFPLSHPKAQVSRTSVRLEETDDQEYSAAEEDFTTATSYGKQHSSASKTQNFRNNNNVDSVSLRDMFVSRSSSPPRVEGGSCAASRISKPKRTETSQSSSPQRQERPKKAQRVEARNSSPDLKSSSPPRAAQSKDLFKGRGSFRQNAIPESTMNEAGSGKATSSLRIKSRPPRKMMMLMDHPSLRQSGQALSSGNTIKHKSKERSKGAQDDIVLSQATMKLDTFCQKQEEKLQARLNGQRSRIDNVDVSDSPPDSGIDHQTIDLLLSRGVKLGEGKIFDKPHPPSHRVKKPSEVVKTANKLTEFNSDRETASVSDPYQVIHKDLPASTLPEGVVRLVSEQAVKEFEQYQGLERPMSSDSKINRDVHQSENTTSNPAPMTAEMLDGKGASGLHTNSNLTRDPTNSIPSHMPELDTSVPHSEFEEHSAVARSDSPTIENADELGDRSLLSQNQGSTSLSPAGQAEQKTGPNIYPDITVKEDGHPSKKQQNKMDGYVNANEEPSDSSLGNLRAMTSASDPKTKDLPRHMTSAIHSAAAHFRAKLDSSKGQPEKVAQPIVHRSEEARSIQEPCMINATLLNAELMSRKLVIKSSPKPTPVVFDAVQAEISPQNGNNLLRDRDSIVTMQQTAASIVPKGVEDAPPRAKMANPATSGRSLQSIAGSTLNTVAPAFTGVMPPPPPRLLNRINRTNPREEAARGRTDAALLREESKGGPWSRESFDLFGTWKPPGRNAGTDVTAA